jgi:hypothetical protein
MQVNQGTRYEWAIDEEVRLERNRRIEARKYLEIPATPSAFSILDAIARDPTVSPAFQDALTPEEIAIEAEERGLADEAAEELHRQEREAERPYYNTKGEI